MELLSVLGVNRGTEEPGTDNVQTSVGRQGRQCLLSLTLIHTAAMPLSKTGRWLFSIIWYETYLQRIL